MAKSTTFFSITVGSGRLPGWYPDWQAPGVVKQIPNSTLKAAIEKNGWTAPTDIVSGGASWPRCLMKTWSGGTVAYVDGYPYLCIMGGGHATNPDNAIYAFGPLTADGPTWIRLGPQSADKDVVSCSARYRDGRPSSRHTVNDFSYGNGHIVMLWKNSAYCENGGTTGKIDVFDVSAREWDAAKAAPVQRIKSHNLTPATHSASIFHAYDGRFYCKGKGAASDSFGYYDLDNDAFHSIGYSGAGTDYDTGLCTMGPRNYLFAVKGSSTPGVRINTLTGNGESWGGAPPAGFSKTCGYDSFQDRIYLPLTGVGSPGATGKSGVAYIDASATSSPSWIMETFSGDVPDEQQPNGTFGRWSYVPQLKGFILVNGVDSPVFFYRTSP